MPEPSISTKKRLMVIFVIVCITLLGLITRLGWIQIVQGDKYKELANEQQTRDIPIPSKRGTIYDRNGKELAISASSNTVWAKPSEISDPEETSAFLAEILDLDGEELLKRLKDTRYDLVRIARWIDDDIGDRIRIKKINGVWLAEDNKRYYPYGNFAAYILGHTTDDNRGMAGIELEYEKDLSGLPGRWIKNTDGAGRQLPFSVERYYPPEDGLSLVLTIDEVIQHFAEKAIENALKIHNGKRAMAIVMDVRTGEILAMAAKPDYDPNNSRIPLDEELKLQIEDMDDEKKLETWFSIWRNPVTNDTYEPGSTFKLITVAGALEEGVASPTSQFYSGGSIKVGGRVLRCWRHYNPHGSQTLTEAVQNSCNPVMVELGQKLGNKKFYHYLEAFGFSNTTGIDLPGERKAIMYDESNAGPVELATMAYGQSISVTPLQLINAISAIANGGKLMQPRIVKELLDVDGKVVKRFEERVLRQVISEKTSRELCNIMEAVVAEGSGKSGYIPGYRVGGKTGTAQKVVDGRYAQGKYVASFIAIAPSDDPRLAVLSIVDEPNGYSHYGSVVAAPIAQEILQESLRYLDIKPQYSKEEAESLVQKEVSIPEVRNMTVREASKILAESRLDFATGPEFMEDGEAIVVDMFPKPNSKVPEGSVIMLYTKFNENLPSAIPVPQLEGKTIREVNTILNAMGLKLKITGNGLATKQMPDPGTKVELGTIVNVEFETN